MKVLLVGVGGVGEAIAQMAKRRPWVEQMVLCDYNVKRAEEVQDKLGDKARFPVEFIDASKQEMIEDLARKYGVNLIMNAVDPIFNKQIFDAAFEVGATYMDMAMTLSEPHPDRPYELPGVKLGDYQFERAKKWEDKGLLALVGIGVEPGMADIFARYAQEHLFDEIEEIGIRDGANLEVEGYEFAPSFSIWTTIEECLNPPIIWEQDRGWFTTAPFSEPEVFDFPEGIGPVEVVNVEHQHREQQPITPCPTQFTLKERQCQTAVGKPRKSICCRKSLQLLVLSLQLMLKGEFFCSICNERDQHHSLLGFDKAVGDLYPKLTAIPKANLSL